jgi:hypothetical protein
MNRLSIRNNTYLLEEHNYLYKENRFIFFVEPNLSLNPLSILINDISLTIVLKEIENSCYIPIYNELFFLTVLKFINNDIALDGIFFNDLDRKFQRRMLNYHFNCVFIDRNQEEEEINKLIKNLKEIKC